MKKEHFGFSRDLIELDASQYVFGVSPLSSIKDLMEVGEWRPYTPLYEPQADKYETYGCTVWGSQNQAETLLKFLTGVEHNFDERYNYNLAEINPPGADPHKVLETFRKHGVTEDVLATTATLEEFKTPRPMTDEYKRIGEKWEWNLGHEWLFTNNPTKAVRLELLRQGLRKSPVAVSVTAWNKDNQGQYTDSGGVPNNHWCVCVALEGECPIVFDSYDQSLKKLSPDHHIEVAKVIYLTKELTSEQKKGFFAQLQAILAWIGLIQKQVDALPKPAPTPKPPTKSELLYEVSRSLLGQRLTLDKSVPINVGCAQAVSYVLKKAGYDIPKGGISGTYTLYEWLQENFQELDEPEAGSIVISPTTVAVGHVGICGQYDYMYYKDFAIMSNDSDTGKYDTHWSLKKWEDYYEKKQKLKTYYFRPL